VQLCAFRLVVQTNHFKSEIQCEKMSTKLPATPTSIATARKKLSNDDKLAIIEASKSPGLPGGLLESQMN